VEKVREELHRILESSSLWDKKVWGLQVTNASEHTLELRALMGAPNGPVAFDLRCYVREKLIAFLQEQYRQSLPRTRAEMTSHAKHREDSSPINGTQLSQSKNLPSAV